jgi:phosphoribosylpyrophosphate synthetase
MKLNLAIDAAKRAAAKEIIPILPYFPYARQDKDQSRGLLASYC